MPPNLTRTIGVDTGGTFTDLVEIGADGRIAFEKAFSTPDSPDQGVLDAITALAGSRATTPSGILTHTTRFAHGTTVSTNAVIQRKGAKVGLLLTHGFEDTLFIARGPIGRAGGLPLAQALDFLHTEVPAPLVPKHLTAGLKERIDVTGTILSPLAKSDVRAAIHKLIDAGAESLAVCLLWSFRNPAHERLVGRIAQEVAPGLPLSLSCDIAPRMGEFERCVTTVVNAYIGPTTTRYIQRLQQRMAAEGFAGQVQIMKSSGGVTLPEHAATDAVAIVNSGPIGGLVAARHVGAMLGHSNIITADMGGTSFDVGIIADGAFEEQRAPFIDQGLPVLIPAIKVVTIGAGGGSIAWSDGFRLQVGPMSAGADPGPACYGRGGTEPTVTDALVALGIISPAHFFGGRHTLDIDAAHRAIESRIATPLGLSTLDAAAGIYEVITARMADLIRKATIESGNDPKDFCLLSYGGAGGAHCARFSAALGIGKVIIPYAASAFSALGCALSDVLFSHTRSDPVPLHPAADAAATINRVLTDLEARVVADMAAAGYPRDQLEFAVKLDLRYAGQMNEVTLTGPGLRMSTADIESLRPAFETHYEQRFGKGTTHAKSALELISVRVEAVRRMPKPDLAPLFKPGASPLAAAPKHHRKVYQHGSGWLDAAIYDFDNLAPGQAVPGPAVIERQTTTVWLPPGSTATLDICGNLEIS